MCSDFDPKESFLSYKTNIYIELYRQECEQKNNAAQKISRVVPLVVAMFGADAYIISRVGKIILDNGFLSDIKSIVLYILCATTICSGAILLFYIIKSCTRYEDIMFDPSNYKLMFELGDKQLKQNGYKQVVSEIDNNTYLGYEEIVINMFHQIRKKEKYISKLYISLVTNYLFACFVFITIWLLY